MSKQCRCGNWFEPKEWQARKSRYECPDCLKESRRQYRERHKERLLAYSRDYYQRNRERMLEYFAERRDDPQVQEREKENKHSYRRTPEYKARQREVMKQWYQDPVYRAHHRARALANRAIKAGKLIRQPCQVCKALPTEAHHEDYNRPLDVIWLCKVHHKQADIARQKTLARAN